MVPDGEQPRFVEIDTGADHAFGGFTCMLTGGDVYCLEDRRPAPSFPQDTTLEGSWEGELETPRAPVFLTLHLQRDGEEWSGSIATLGDTHPLGDVVPTEDGVRAVLVPGPDGFGLEADLTDGRLVGRVTEGDDSYPLELDRLPRYPEPDGRVAGWRQDLEALAERFLRFDRSFTPAERSLFIERVENLRDRLPELDDSEIRMRVAAAVALSGNAHTRLYLLRNRTELRRLPVRLWWFGDGVYVVRSTSRHEELLGCRVDAIEGLPARFVRDSVATAFAGNPSWIDYKSVYYMTSPGALHGFGLAPDPERVGFSFSGCGRGSFERHLEPLPLARSREPIEAWRDLSPRHPEAGWVQALERSSVTPPLHLRHPELHYWFEYLEEPGILYVQYSRASEMEEEDLDTFGERLLGELRDRDPGALVLDLRFNTGGSLGLAQDLMAKLERRTSGMPRFVITGRATFSAGITHVATWKEAGDVRLVGEPVGDALDYWSEGGNILLPNSGLTAHFANAFHGYSEAPCPEDVPCFLDLSAPPLRPDLPASASWDDYAAGVDVAMDAVRAAVRQRDER